MDENGFLMLLQAKLDEAKSKENINNTDIPNLQNKLDALKLQATLDQKSVQSLADEIGKLVNQKIVISNIGIDTSGLNKSGQKAANDFSNGMSQGLKKSSNILNSFKKSLENMGMGSKEIDTVATRISGLVTEIQSLDQTRTSGKKDILSVNIAGIDQYGQAIKLTQQYNVATGELINVIDNVSTVQQKAGSATEAFIEKQKKAVASAQNTLSTIETKLNDSNVTKSLANTDFDSNGLTAQLERVRTSISALENASRDTFTQAQIDVDKEITSLNNLITTLKNAEYAATSLRTKDINTVKIDEGNNLNTFVQKMEQSGHYTDELKQKVENLRTQLNGVFDANTLTSYLNSLSNLESEFKSIDATAKTLEKSTKLQTNIEAEKKILQVYTNELKEAGVLTDDVKEKIQNMFYSLSKVDSQNGLTTWRTELKGVKAETDAVLKSVTQEKSEEEKLANALATVREKTEQARKTEEQRQQLAQNSAINKALEQEYQERLKVAEATKAQVDKIQLSIETGGYESKVESLIAKTQQWTDSEGKARINTEALSQALINLNTASSALSNNNTVTNQQALITAEKELDVQIKLVTNSVRSMNAELAKDSTIASLHNKIQEFYDKNSAAHRMWGTQLKQMLTETSSGAQLTKQRVREISTAFNEVGTAAKQAGKLGQTAFQEMISSISSKLGSLTYYFSASFMLMKGIQSIKSGISTVKALDTALVDLKKTTTMTASELEDFYYSSNKVAKQMGVTTEEIINQASAWSRLNKMGLLCGDV